MGGQGRHGRYEPHWTAVGRRPLGLQRLRRRAPASRTLTAPTTRSHATHLAMVRHPAQGPTSRAGRPPARAAKPHLANVAVIDCQVGGVLVNDIDSECLVPACAGRCVRGQGVRDAASVHGHECMGWPSRRAPLWHAMALRLIDT